MDVKFVYYCVDPSNWGYSIQHSTTHLRHLSLLTESTPLFIFSRSYAVLPFLSVLERGSNPWDWSRLSFTNSIKSLLQIEDWQARNKQLESAFKTSLQYFPNILNKLVLLLVNNKSKGYLFTSSNPAIRLSLRLIFLFDNNENDKLQLFGKNEHCHWTKSFGLNQIFLAKTHLTVLFTKLTLTTSQLILHVTEMISAINLVIKSFQ